MTNETNKPNPKPKRLSQSQRKHVRRLKQTARKTGIAYTASRPVLSTSRPPALL